MSFALVFYSAVIFQVMKVVLFWCKDKKSYMTCKIILENDTFYVTFHPRDYKTYYIRGRRKE